MTVPEVDGTVYNGIPASHLTGASWRKSRLSQGVSNCVELAPLPAGRVAVRNSRHPDGPALIHTHAEIADLITRAKSGELDPLT